MLHRDYKVQLATRNLRLGKSRAHGSDRRASSRQAHWYKESSTATHTAGAILILRLLFVETSA